MNPELQRQLWLEATPQRLWLIPVALFGSSTVLAHYMEAALPSLALIGFIALTLVWGSRQAADGVLDEVREHTWDLQRMSALPPWTMTWGKLVGSTLMPWYAGACCLAIYFAFRPPAMFDNSMHWSLLLVLIAAATQGVALLGAVVSIHRDQRRRARLHTGIVLALLAMALPDLVGSLFTDVPDLGPDSARVYWYGRYYDGAGFSLVLAACLAGWAVFGAFRAMCIELKVRTLPWAWACFAAHAALVAQGFHAGAVSAGTAGWLNSFALTATLLAYVAGFAFARDPVQYRRLLQSWREARLRRVVEDSPLWISSLGVALVAAVAAVATGAGAGSAILATLAVRDLALLSALSFARGGRRAEIVTVLVVATLNRLGPALLHALDLPHLATWLNPATGSASTALLGCALLQAAVACALAVAAWRTSMRGSQPTR